MQCMDAQQHIAREAYQMIESNGVNTSILAGNYSQLPSDTSFSYEESGQVAGQENFLLRNDQVTLSYSAEFVTTYNRTRNLDMQATDSLDLLRGLVLNIFKEQGMDSVIATDDSMVDMTPLSQEEAQELIAEDGYFGVEKTSERIFQFAIGVAGGDPARIEAIRRGVENGFEQALEALGGWLPDVTYDTYDEVMTKLDDWAGGSTSQTIEN